MTILVLGNGGAINSGLHYNSFLINYDSLCELPPDIMFTLNDNKIDILKIRNIFVSHLHGDHTFGFPFLILNLFYNQSKNKIDLYGPHNTKDNLTQLVINAFTDSHPCLNWMNEYINFIEINDIFHQSFIDSYKMKYFILEHPIETYGFSIYKDNNYIFSYIADTHWNENIENILKEKPKVVIIDLNGKKDDVFKVHISIDDLIENGIKITGNDTLFYGTHLKDEFVSNDKIICSKYKEIIRIEERGHSS